MTNYDRIKAMSIDEMAEYFGGDAAEEYLLCASCRPEYCKHYREYGFCHAEGHNKCVPAMKNWLESEDVQI